MFEVIKPHLDFIFGSVKRDFQLKFSKSLVSFIWPIAQPLAMIATYVAIFSNFIGVRAGGNIGTSSLNYALSVCSGMILWVLFAEIFSKALNIFIENANLIKKIKFPIIYLPIILVINAWINYSILVIILIMILALVGFKPLIALSALLIFGLLVTLLAISLGIFLGFINVIFRDVGYFFFLFLQFWFWLTPIVYPASALPNGIQILITLNPLTSIIQSVQEIIIYQNVSINVSIIYPVLITCIGFYLCHFLFVNFKSEMIDEL